jgi:transposase-like protein
MAEKRRRYSAEFKFRLALEAAKGICTVNQLAGEHEVHPNQISRWKQRLTEEGTTIFTDRRKRRERDQAELEKELYEQIGRLRMELEWLKKKAARYV